jgi:hypothetical protein
MPDRTTVVELVIDPTELFAVTRMWAQGSGFAVHEQRPDRTLYTRNVRAGKAWLSVENDGKNAKLEAWLAPRGKGAESSDSFWTGWKTALPQGLAFGPASIYKKHFMKLLDLLTSRAESIGERRIMPELNKPRIWTTRTSLAKILGVGGIIYLVSGLLGLASPLIFPAFAAISITPPIASLSDTLLGLLSLATSRALSKGKAIAIWLYGGTLLVDIAANLSKGHQPNFLVLSFGLLFLWQMLALKKQGELS